MQWAIIETRCRLFHPLPPGEGGGEGEGANVLPPRSDLRLCGRQ